MTIIEVLVSLIYAYFLLGILFGIYFAFLGAKRMDEKIAESGFGVRLILLPGAIFLWPVIIMKMIKRK